RVGLRGDRRRLDELSRSRSLRLYDLALESVEGTQLRSLQEPEGRRGARGGAAGGEAGREKAPLRRGLEAPDGGRALRVPLLTAAGVRHAAGIRGLRPHSDLRRDLSVAQGRALDGQVSGSLAVNGTRLYVETLGQGRPMLCLHGGPGTD